MNLIELIGQKLGVPECKINMHSNFVDDLGADSLDQIELIMACEDRYNLEISDEEANKVATVQDAFDTLEKLGVVAEKLKSHQLTSADSDYETALRVFKTMLRESPDVNVGNFAWWLKQRLNRVEKTPNFS